MKTDPGSVHFSKNVRRGATADTVLLSYLDQYQVEHAFRLMKDGMGIDRVYIHRPSRENAMRFVISLATMVSDIVTHVLKENGMDLTMQGVSGKIYSMDLVCEGDEEYLDGLRSTRNCSRGWSESSDSIRITSSTEESNHSVQSSSISYGGIKEIQKDAPNSRVSNLLTHSERRLLAAKQQYSNLLLKSFLCALGYLE